MGRMNACDNELNKYLFFEIFNSTRTGQCAKILTPPPNIWTSSKPQNQKMVQSYNTECVNTVTIYSVITNIIVTYVLWRTWKLLQT